MKILFSERAWEEYLHWQRNDLAKLKRVNELVRDIRRNPDHDSAQRAVGKPEPLRREYKSYWSRRIDTEHRLVYKIVDGVLWIAQCQYHY